MEPGDIYLIGNNDGTGWCQCERCQALDPDDEKAACALAAESPVPAHLANMNSPRQTVVAISQADAAEFFAFLDARGIEHKNVPVGWAFHSPLVEQAAAAFCAHLNANDFHRPVTPIYTERSGELVPPESFDRTFPDWLPLHILEPIRFDMLAAAMARDGIRVFLEIGAGGTLTRLIKDNLPNAGITAMTMDTSGADGMAHWNRVFARLYVEAGRTFDLGVYADIFAGQLRPARVNAEPGLGWTSTPAPEPAAKNMDITPAASAQQNDELHEKVRSLIARHTGFDKGVLSGNMALQEALGLDSLKMMELGLDLERAFGRPILVSALPRGLTLDGLVERIRSGEAFASSGAAAKQPRRWVLARRPLPPAPLLTPVSDSDARPVWLLTNDTELAAAWEKARMGETRILSRQATLPSPPDSFEATPRGIVLALRNSLLPQESWAQWDGALAFGHALGSRWLPALRKRLHGDNTHFQVITSVIGETDKLDAAWPALTLSMQREYPGFLCAHLRLEGRASAATALQRLCRELKVPEPRHPVVFSRKFARFTEHLEELAALPSANSINLQPDDAVLVTGGGRGITARIITSLATSLKPAWILAGSTPLDAGTPQAKARQMTAQTLRQAGCRVIEWVYDLSSESEALAMIERLGHEFPRLAGVIHGAGALADSMIEDKPLEDFLRVFRVKAWSALLLEKALDLSSLRFWINFGSLAAFLGNSGQTDYAAANAMLSAQAFRLRAAGVPLAKTILWSAWQGEGMAASEAMQSALKAAGVSAIEPEEGVRFFETELREPAATVVAFGGEPLGMAADLPMRADPVWAGYRAAGASLRMLTKSFLEAEPFLRDHRINGACVLPGVMALELSARLPQAGIGPLAWENVQFHRVLRATSGRLALALEWTALRAAAIEFSLREADAEDVAFSGTMRLHVFRRRSAQQPAIGPLKAELALGELYGSQGRLFSGPAFQALGQGACIYARAAKAALTAPATLFYSNGVAPVVPVAAVDACMQLAALWLLEHGHGPCLPASIAYAWWCGDAAVSGSCAACVWHKGKSADGHALFDATIMAGRRVCWVIKGLAMAAVEGAG